MNHPIPSLSQNPKVKYIKQQETAASHLLENFLSGKHYSLLTAAAGDGKTFVNAGLIKELYAQGFFNKNGTFWLGPDILWLTAQTAIEQTRRVLEDLF